MRWPCSPASLGLPEYLLLLQWGSDWYLSTDNCNLGGEGESERAFQKCKWLRKGLPTHGDRGPRPVPVVSVLTGRQGLQEQCVQKDWVLLSQLRWECRKEESGLVSCLTLHNACWDSFMSGADSWSKGLELGKSWMKRVTLLNRTSLYSIIQIRQQKAKLCISP